MSLRRFLRRLFRRRRTFTHVTAAQVAVGDNDQILLTQVPVAQHDDLGDVTKHVSQSNHELVFAQDVPGPNEDTIQCHVPHHAPSSTPSRTSHDEPRVAQLHDEDRSNPDDHNEPYEFTSIYSSVVANAGHHPLDLPSDSAEQIIAPCNSPALHRSPSRTSLDNAIPHLWLSPELASPASFPRLFEDGTASSSSRIYKSPGHEPYGPAWTDPATATTAESMSRGTVDEEGSESSSEYGSFESAALIARNHPQIQSQMSLTTSSNKRSVPIRNDLPHTRGNRTPTNDHHDTGVDAAPQFSHLTHDLANASTTGEASTSQTHRDPGEETSEGSLNQSSLTPSSSSPLLLRSRTLRPTGRDRGLAEILRLSLPRSKFLAPVDLPPSPATGSRLPLASSDAHSSPHSSKRTGKLGSMHRGPSGKVYLTDGRIRYVLRDELGKGGYAKVFLATAHALDRDDAKNIPAEVAIKVYPKDKLQDDRFGGGMFEAALAEKDSLATLTQGSDVQGAVRLISSFQTDFFVCIAMELCVGDLRKLQETNVYRKMVLGPLTIRNYAAELLICLEQLHLRGIAHGDLKLDNVLITRSGHLVLADFNIASRYVADRKSPHPQHLYRVGTVGYLAPEHVLCDHRNCDDLTIDKDLFFASEMWSYGVIIAELCLDGRLMPNLSYTTSMDEYGECLVKWSFESSNIKGTVPDDLHDLLSKLLKVNPRERLKLEDAKDHPFFAEIDWYKIEQRQWEPPRAIRLPRERGTVNLKQLFSASMPKRVAKPPTPAPSRYTSELASTAPESVGTAPGASNLYDWSRFEWSILDDPDYYLVKGPAARRG